MTEKERDQVRHLQDRLLALPVVVQFVARYGDLRSLWEGGPAVSHMRQMIFPTWTRQMEDLIDEYAKKGQKTKGGERCKIH